MLLDENSNIKLIDFGLVANPDVCFKHHLILFIKLTQYNLTTCDIVSCRTPTSCWRLPVGRLLMQLQVLLSFDIAMSVYAQVVIVISVGCAVCSLRQCLG